ncbi:hypothetical protein K474DRAFT_1673553 [Panus rudis PR-1116 ss-1]|nr:hypothetical protein K474DRAFT_1673553 [Panus rudis PR-1116 ss-1]
MPESCSSDCSDRQLLRTIDDIFKEQVVIPYPPFPLKPPLVPCESSALSGRCICGVAEGVALPCSCFHRTHGVAPKGHDWAGSGASHLVSLLWSSRMTVVRRVLKSSNDGRISRDGRWQRRILTTLRHRQDGDAEELIFGVLFPNHQSGGPPRGNPRGSIKPARPEVSRKATVALAVRIIPQEILTSVIPFQWLANFVRGVEGCLLPQPLLPTRGSKLGIGYQTSHLPIGGYNTHQIRSSPFEERSAQTLQGWRYASSESVGKNTSALLHCSFS